MGCAKEKFQCSNRTLIFTLAGKGRLGIHNLDGPSGGKRVRGNHEAYMQYYRVLKS